MSAIKDGRYPIALDRERHLLFSMNVLDELQDKCGGYDKLTEFLQGKDLFKRLRWLLALLINEGAEPGDEPLTEIQVGRMIHTGNLSEVQASIFRAFSLGINGNAEPDSADEDAYGGEEEKNAISG